MINECVCIVRKKETIILFYSIINTKWGIALQTDRNLHMDFTSEGRSLPNSPWIVCFHFLPYGQGDV
jgi:hypothetical protein